MKKITLLTTLLFSLLLFNIEAQILQSEDFDLLPVGDVGTDISGTVPGQGGLLTFTDAGTNSDFQITDSGGSLGNVLTITGSSDGTGSRFVWLNGLPTEWSSRTLGNDIIEIEYNFFTGPATTSDVTTGIRLYDASFNTIAGFRFVPATKVITGLAYFDPGGGGAIGAYFFNLGSMGAEITLDENTWYRIGFAFNVTTGDVTWRGPGFYSGIGGALAGSAPAEIDFTLFPSALNAASTFASFDGFRARAVATENLLGVNDNDRNITNNFKIYPNPVQDMINVSLSNNIKATKLEVVDMNGRIVKSLTKENSLNKVNVSELSAGMYILNIYSIEGKVSKRFIKTSK